MLLWGCSLLFFRANVDLLIGAVSAPPAPEKAVAEVRVSNLVVEETDSWTDDGDTDEDVDDDDPGAASGWGMKL